MTGQERDKNGINHMDSIENRKFLLTNEYMPYLSESVEGGTMFDFCDEFQAVSDALHTCGVDIASMRPKLRLLFVLRAFYLLGMLRGGESYREDMLVEYDLLDDVEFEPCKFALDEICADKAKDDLEATDPNEINKLLKMLGLGK